MPEDKGLEKKMADRNTLITDFHGYDGDKRTLLSNMIEPELGLHILNESKRNIQPELFYSPKRKNAPHSKRILYKK